ncbi:unnamed protein product [Linum trigynum]|uniref:Acyl-ACP thioesterase-like C-terminal domain-containing protein n=1 Tax=Linum trigynum TaxID=586398 RepID=A0AAV2ET89_9ROSI
MHHMQSVAINVLEEYHLMSLTLEYRRECRQSNLVESLTSSSHANRKADVVEFTHLIRLQCDKAEIVRARTEWQPKLTTHLI